MQLFEQAPTKDELLAYIDTQQSPAKLGTICDHFGIVCPTPDRRKGSVYSQVRSILRELAREGAIARRQHRPRGWYWYYSIPRLVEEVQQEQAQKPNVNLQPVAPSISLDDLKAKAKECSRRMHKLQDEIDNAQQELDKQSARLDVLLSLIDPFDADFEPLWECHND